MVMSGSSSPPSHAAGKASQDALGEQPEGTGADTPRSFRRRLNLRLAALMRWTHIYFSMFGLAALLFFSVTGITVNHPDWFYGGGAAHGPAPGGEEGRGVGFQGPPGGRRP